MSLDPSFNGTVQFRFACGLLRQVGREEEAISELRRCIEWGKLRMKKSPQENMMIGLEDPVRFLFDIHMTIGSVRQKQDDEGAARCEYEKCLQVMPGNEEAHLSLARLDRLYAQSVADLERSEQHLRAGLDSIHKKISKDDITVEMQREMQDELSMLLCQQGKDAKAILTESGYMYRLAKEVLFYLQPDEKGNYANGTVSREHSPYCSAVDNVLPPAMLTKLQKAFGRQSPFWKEHNYGSIGYFSYLHQLTKKQATNSMDQIVKYLQFVVAEHYPQVKEARFAEWWAHCRPHSSGHQMHFDSDDEGRGQVRNPLISTVCYLTDSPVMGGPTLVTNQHLGKPLADKGWLIFPRFNRLAMFNGSVLHGVVPGRLGEGIDPPPPAGGRRITLMVAFWKDVRPQMDLGDMHPGSSQPFPNSAKTKYTWPRLLEKQDDWDTFTQDFQTVQKGSRKDVDPVALQRVWEDVDIDANSAKKQEFSALTALPPYDTCFQGF